MSGYRTNEAVLTDRRIPVISPHADDETFGCAGTILKARSLGSKVFLMYVSVGGLVHYSSEHRSIAGDVRAAEIEAAAKAMGVDDYTILYNDAHLQRWTCRRA